jgi:hypothetical protein
MTGLEIRLREEHLKSCGHKNEVEGMRLVPDKLNGFEDFQI